jgi:LmbE family N-acetylglucosaminyl deacetylase
MNFDYKDCSLRGYTDETEINSNVLLDFFYIENQNIIFEKLSNFDFDILFCPLTIGNHIDHQIIFEIVNQMNLDKQQVVYYEDFPYASEYSLPQIDLFAANKLGNSYNIEIDISNVFDAKLEKLNIYKSQVNKREINMIKKYATSLKSGKIIERVWIRK